MGEHETTVSVLKIRSLVWRLGWWVDRGFTPQVHLVSWGISPFRHTTKTVSSKAFCILMLIIRRVIDLKTIIVYRCGAAPVPSVFPPCCLSPPVYLMSAEHSLSTSNQRLRFFQTSVFPLRNGYVTQGWVTPAFPPIRLLRFTLQSLPGSQTCTATPTCWGLLCFSVLWPTPAKNMSSLYAHNSFPLLPDPCFFILTSPLSCFITFLPYDFLPFRSSPVPGISASLSSFPSLVLLTSPSPPVYYQPNKVPASFVTNSHFLLLCNIHAAPSSSAVVH